MALKVLVTSLNEDEPQNLKVDDFEIRDVLGKKENKIGVKVEELFNSVIDNVSKSLSTESELTIEVSGAVTLQAEAGAKWMFFNLGGKASKTDNMKVVLKTKIAPTITEEDGMVT